MNSSVVIRVCRRVAAGSLVWAAVTAAAERLRRMRGRIIVGLGGAWSDRREMQTTARLDILVADSRVITALWSLATAPSAARREARARRLLCPVLGLDLPARVRLAGCVIVTAVLTHVVLLAVLGVPVHGLGWVIRVALVAAGSMAIWRPGAHAVADAWQDRTGSPAIGARWRRSSDT